MQAMNQMITDSLSMLTSQVQPVENGVGCTMLDPAHGTQAGALDQHHHNINKSVPIRAQGFEESSFVSTKGLVTDSAVISSVNIAMNFDVFATRLSKVSTRLVITPLLLGFHCASPQVARCINSNANTAFHGLAIQHPAANLTASSIVTS
jgi:hypothetical protein